MEKLDVMLEVVENIPVPISIQRPDHTVIYENPAMVDLFGEHSDVHCSVKFGDESATFPIEMRESFGHLKRVQVRGDQWAVLLIKHVPLSENGKVTHLVEYILDFTMFVADGNSGEVVTMLMDNIQLSIVRFGHTGSERVISEALSFLGSQSLDHFLTMYGAFWMAALGQGPNSSTGFFGPLPVLHYLQRICFAFAAYMESQTADFRFDGEDYVIVLIFTDVDFQELFVNHKRLGHIISEQLSLAVLAEDLTDIHLQSMKKNIVDYLKDNINALSILNEGKFVDRVGS